MDLTVPVFSDIINDEGLDFRWQSAGVRMAIREIDLEGRNTPPYGPARGMLQALELLRRTTPHRIDSDFLRASGVAPGNEYKVAGALKFLGLIDNEGRATDKSRLLKTKGITYTQALQEIVRTAYRDLFQGLQEKEATSDEVYNYFVTEGGMGSEMATKATRFFVKLCRLAEIELLSGNTQASVSKRKRAEKKLRHYPQPRFRDETTAPLPLVIALTPETAVMDVNHLTDLFRKMRIAWERSLTKEG
ncbi:DUF5343 domain-containing protein [Chloroflexota bacterium]